MANGELTLTARAIACGAFVGVMLLAGASLGAHIAFTVMGLDDGGVVTGMLQTTVGAAIGALGAVVTFLFGSRTPA